MVDCIDGMLDKQRITKTECKNSIKQDNSIGTLLLSNDIEILTTQSVKHFTQARIRANKCTWYVIQVAVQFQA
jgi:hypothetical protein